MWDDKLKRFVNTDSKEDPVEAIKPPPILQSQLKPTNDSNDNGAQAMPQSGENRFSLKSQSMFTNL